MVINSKIIEEVKEFLESGNRNFLKEIMNLDRNDITGQAVVRYLIQLNHWPFTSDSDFSKALDYFFAVHPDRTTIDPDYYQSKTFELIKDAFDYECTKVVHVVQEPDQVETKAPSKKEKSAPSGSKTFKSLKEIDTAGASDRLKRVIDIQRNS